MSALLALLAQRRGGGFCGPHPPALPACLLLLLLLAVLPDVIRGGEHKAAGWLANTSQGPRGGTTKSTTRGPGGCSVCSGHPAPSREPAGAVAADAPKPPSSARHVRGPGGRRRPRTRASLKESAAAASALGRRNGGACECSPCEASATAAAGGDDTCLSADAGSGAAGAGELPPEARTLVWATALGLPGLPPVSIVPRFLDWRVQRACAPSQAAFYLINTSNSTTLEVLSVATDNLQFYPADFRAAQLAPGQRIVVSAIYLPRALGDAHGTLVMQTSAGRLAVPMHGHALPNPNGLPPVTILRTQAGQRLVHSIALHNPHKEPLRIVEAFTQEPFLHLRAPVAPDGPPHGRPDADEDSASSAREAAPGSKWGTVPPGQERAAVEIDFTETVVGRYMSVVHLRLARGSHPSEQQLMVPIDIHVVRGGVHALGEVVFGTLTRREQTVTRGVELLNAANAPLTIEEVHFAGDPDPNLVDVTFERGLVIPPGTSVRALELTYAGVQPTLGLVPPAADAGGDGVGGGAGGGPQDLLAQSITWWYAGRLLVRTNDSSARHAEISYQARVVHGAVEPFPLACTTFVLPPQHPLPAPFPPPPSSSSPASAVAASAAQYERYLKDLIWGREEEGEEEEEEEEEELIAADRRRGADGAEEEEEQDEDEEEEGNAGEGRHGGGCLGAKNSGACSGSGSGRSGRCQLAWVPRVSERQVTIHNRFPTPLLLFAVSTSDADFEVVDFPAGATLLPETITTLFTVRYLARVPHVHATRAPPGAHLVVSTNLSELLVPLHVLSGRLLCSLEGAEGGGAAWSERRRRATPTSRTLILEMGLVAVGYVRRTSLNLTNPGPDGVPLVEISSAVPGLMLSLEALYDGAGRVAAGVAQAAPLAGGGGMRLLEVGPAGKPARKVGTAEKPLLTIHPGATAALVIQIAPSHAEKQRGVLLLSTSHEVFIVRVAYEGLTGGVTLEPSHLSFPPSFPGRPLRQPLHATSTFGRQLALSGLTSPDPRIVTELSLVVLPPGVRTEIGSVTFDPARLAAEDLYMPVPSTLGSDSWTAAARWTIPPPLASASAASASASASAAAGAGAGAGAAAGAAAAPSVCPWRMGVGEEDIDAMRQRRDRWRRLVDSGRISIETRVSLLTEAAASAGVTVKASLSRPSVIASEEGLQFAMVQVGSTALQSVRVTNPSDAPVRMGLLVPPAPPRPHKNDRSNSDSHNGRRCCPSSAPLGALFAAAGLGWGQCPGGWGSGSGSGSGLGLGSGSGLLSLWGFWPLSSSSSSDTKTPSSSSSSSRGSGSSRKTHTSAPPSARPCDASCPGSPGSSWWRRVLAWAKLGGGGSSSSSDAQFFFLVPGAMAEAVVPPRAEVLLGPVAFRPRHAGEHHGRLYVRSNLTCLESLPLFGEGGTGHLAFAEAVYSDGATSGATVTTRLERRSQATAGNSGSSTGGGSGSTTGGGDDGGGGSTGGDGSGSGSGSRAGAAGEERGEQGAARGLYAAAAAAAHSPVLRIDVLEAGGGEQDSWHSCGQEQESGGDVKLSAAVRAAGVDGKGGGAGATCHSRAAGGGAFGAGCGEDLTGAPPRAHLVGDTSARLRREEGSDSSSSISSSSGGGGGGGGGGRKSDRWPKLVCRTFRAVNQGNLALHVHSFGLTGGGPQCSGRGFALSPCRSFSLAPNESTDLTVSYRPNHPASLVRQHMWAATSAGRQHFTLEVRLPAALARALGSVPPGDAGGGGDYTLRRSCLAALALVLFLLVRRAVRDFTVAPAPWFSSLVHSAQLAHRSRLFAAEAATTAAHRGGAGGAGSGDAAAEAAAAGGQVSPSAPLSPGGKSRRAAGGKGGNASRGGGLSDGTLAAAAKKRSEASAKVATDGSGSNPASGASTPAILQTAAATAAAAASEKHLPGGGGGAAGQLAPAPASAPSPAPSVTQGLTQGQGERHAMNGRGSPKPSAIAARRPELWGANGSAPSVAVPGRRGGGALLGSAKTRSSSAGDIACQVSPALTSKPAKSSRAEATGVQASQAAAGAAAASGAGAGTRAGAGGGGGAAANGRMEIAAGGRKASAGVAGSSSQKAGGGTGTRPGAEAGAGPPEGRGPASHTSSSSSSSSSTSPSSGRAGEPTDVAGGGSSSAQAGQAREGAAGVSQGQAAANGSWGGRRGGEAARLVCNTGSHAQSRFISAAGAAAAGAPAPAAGDDLPNGARETAQQGGEDSKKQQQQQVLHVHVPAPASAEACWSLMRSSSSSSSGASGSSSSSSSESGSSGGPGAGAGADKCFTPSYVRGHGRSRAGNGTSSSRSSIGATGGKEAGPGPLPASPPASSSLELSATAAAEEGVKEKEKGTSGRRRRKQGLAGPAAAAPDSVPAEAVPNNTTHSRQVASASAPSSIGKPSPVKPLGGGGGGSASSASGSFFNPVAPRGASPVEPPLPLAPATSLPPPQTKPSPGLAAQSGRMPSLPAGASLGDSGRRQVADKELGVGDFVKEVGFIDLSPTHISSSSDGGASRGRGGTAALAAEALPPVSEALLAPSMWVGGAGRSSWGCEKSLSAGGGDRGRWGGGGGGGGGGAPGVAVAPSGAGVVAAAAAGDAGEQYTRSVSDPISTFPTTAAKGIGAGGSRSSNSGVASGSGIGSRGVATNSSSWVANSSSLASGSIFSGSGSRGGEPPSEAEGRSPGSAAEAWQAASFGPLAPELAPGLQLSPDPKPLLARGRPSTGTGEALLGRLSPYLGSSPSSSNSPLLASVTASASVATSGGDKCASPVRTVHSPGPYKPAMGCMSPGGAALRLPDSPFSTVSPPVLSRWQQQQRSSGGGGMVARTLHKLPSFVDMSADPVLVRPPSSFLSQHSLPAGTPSQTAAAQVAAPAAALTGGLQGASSGGGGGTTAVHTLSPGAVVLPGVNLGSSLSLGLGAFGLLTDEKPLQLPKPTNAAFTGIVGQPPATGGGRSSCKEAQGAANVYDIWGDHLAEFSIKAASPGGAADSAAASRAMPPVSPGIGLGLGGSGGGGGSSSLFAQVGFASSGAAPLTGSVGGGVSPFAYARSSSSEASPAAGGSCFSGAPLPSFSIFSQGSPAPSVDPPAPSVALNASSLPLDQGRFAAGVLPSPPLLQKASSAKAPPPGSPGFGSSPTKSSSSSSSCSSSASGSGTKGLQSAFWMVPPGQPLSATGGGGGNGGNTLGFGTLPDTAREASGGDPMNPWLARPVGGGGAYAAADALKTAGSLGPPLSSYWPPQSSETAFPGMVSFSEDGGSLAGVSYSYDEEDRGASGNA